MYKYACLNPISEKGLKRFSENYSEAAENEKADVILVRSAKMHEMEFDKNLLAIARAGAGVNNIPLEKCAEEGIVVFNTPGANANGVKELVLFGLIAGVRDICGGIEWVKTQTENEDVAAAAEKEKKKFVGNEIADKTIGIIGLGAIGVKVANACCALGMQVKGYDAFLSQAAKDNLDAEVNIEENLEDVIKNADFISLHVPALDATKGMVNSSLMEKMKDGVVIINAARDTLVNEDNLEKALDSGKVAKYVCDFPTAKNVKMKNALIIPHLGASTEESEENCAIMAVDELKDYLENGNIINSVNYPALNMGPLKGTRIAVCHKSSLIPKNFEDAISSFGAIAKSESNINGDYAYSLFEMENDVDDEVASKLCEVSDILKARVIR